MAINPNSLYPANTNPPSAGYPLGSPRNDVVDGDGSGTPLEETWLKDLWGFFQALLAGASITPSGIPDRVGASQYLSALVELFRAPSARYLLGLPTDSLSGTLFTLTQEFADSGFSLLGGGILVPTAGRYLVAAHASLRSSETANPRSFGLGIRVNSLLQVRGRGQRFSADPGAYTPVSAFGIINVSDPAHVVDLQLIGGGNNNIHTGGGFANADRLFSISRVSRPI